MLKALKATYVDGKFVLDEKLDSEWEGKPVTIMLEADETSESEQEGQTRVEQFLEKWKQHPGTEMSEDYKFDHNKLD